MSLVIHSFASVGTVKYCLLYDPLTVIFTDEPCIDAMSIYLASVRDPWIEHTKLEAKTVSGMRIRAGVLAMFQPHIRAEIIEHCKRFYAPLSDAVHAAEYTTEMTRVLYKQAIVEFMRGNISSEISNYSTIFNAAPADLPMFSPIDINDYIDVAGVYIIAIACVSTNLSTRVFQYGHSNNLATHILGELRRIRRDGFTAELCLASRASDCDRIMEYISNILEQHAITSTRVGDGWITTADITPVMKKYAKCAS